MSHDHALDPAGASPAWPSALPYLARSLGGNRRHAQRLAETDHASAIRCRGVHRRRSVAQAGGGERMRDLFARQAEQRDLATCITEFYLRAQHVHRQLLENRLMQVGGQRDDQLVGLAPH